MVRNINLQSMLNEKYHLSSNTREYRIIHRKFNNRFPLEKVDQLLDSVNNSYVKIFVDIMNLNHKQKYMENFYSNLANSKIVKSKFWKRKLLGQELYGGSFTYKRNNYIIFEDLKKLEECNAVLTPYHELLHLLTMRFDSDDALRYGFKYNGFANGLNEGYTDLLTKRYFGFLGTKDFYAYLHFQWVAEMLEEIVGRNKMEDFYFSSSIEGLIIELEKYISREEVITLIEDMDLLFFSEDQLFGYQKDFLYNKKELDEKKTTELYDFNKELREKIYETVLLINEKRTIPEKNKRYFKLKNDIIKKRYDKEEREYQNYFRKKAKERIKQR